MQQVDILTSAGLRIQVVGLQYQDAWLLDLSEARRLDLLGSHKVLA